MERIPYQFNVMLVKDKKPLAPWKELTEREQTPEERSKVLSIAQPGTLGIITGPISRLFVLDIDGPEGEKSIEGRHIPRSWEVKTPHGRHIYYRWTAALEDVVTTKAGILGGVDVRGHGGFVVWYGWSLAPHLVPLAAPPQWLIDLLPKKESKTITAGPLATLGSIREGNRNQSFTSLAGGLRARGYTIDVIFELLRPKAREVGFSETELMAVCRSIGRYDAPKLEGQGESVEAFLADRQDVKWICEPFIAEQSIGFIAGLPETRKTFVLFDLAIECARAGVWMDRFPISRPYKVLVIDQERAKSETQRRFQALLTAKGINAASLKGSLFLRCGTTTRIDIQASFDSLKKELADIRPEIILIDSFAAFHTKNESSRMEIQQVLERVKEIRNEFKCAILFVHHETKSAYANHKEGAPSSYLDMAGNVAIPAAAEFCMNVVKHGEDSSFCHHTKSTLGVKAPPFVVKVEDVAGGICVRAF